MRVERAGYRDIRGWLDLAAEVEPLFGGMLDDPGFYQALLKHIGRGTALCVREEEGVPGAALAGALLFSPPGPGGSEGRIGWLAVASKWRRHGIGRMLVEQVAGLVQPPVTLSVITFGEEAEEGRPARRFYERLGFHPAEPAPPGPEGGSRQVYRRTFETTCEGSHANRSRIAVTASHS